MGLILNGVMNVYKLILCTILGEGGPQALVVSRALEFFPREVKFIQTLLENLLTHKIIIVMPKLGANTATDLNIGLRKYETLYYQFKLSFKGLYYNILGRYLIFSSQINSYEKICTRYLLLIDDLSVNSSRENLSIVMICSTRRIFDVYKQFQNFSIPVNSVSGVVMALTDGCTYAIVSTGYRLNPLSFTTTVLGHARSSRYQQQRWQ
ncbi:hypothetical protein AGLY_003636 [Aphis glycines]|uniref:Uncharacterized protein n=1 Tax=Aphis glycines TaxID=307491 RepID=A0A6G0TZ61_APHGL|nr:hypothetical protein AGLY_003636 [Aphis glycines]